MSSGSCVLLILQESRAVAGKPRDATVIIHPCQQRNKGSVADGRCYVS